MRFTLLFSMFATGIATKSSLRGTEQGEGLNHFDRSLQSSCTNSFVCPTNSVRIPNRQCYDTFDDCQCNTGFVKSGSSCTSTNSNGSGAGGCTNSFVCPTNSVRIPNRQCYDTFDDCQCNTGFVKDGNVCVPAAPTSCPNKKIRISKFCVDGEPGDECCLGARDDIEVILSLDSTKKYYPDQTTKNCDGNEPDTRDGDTFCVVREKSCMFMSSSKFQTIEGFQSLSVGLEEHDNGSQNDEEFGTALPEQWFSDDCRPYEVQIFREFGPETTVTSCYSISGSVSATAPLRGVDVSGEVGASFERCETFVKPAESFIWTIEVRPE